MAQGNRAGSAMLSLYPFQCRMRRWCGLVDFDGHHVFLPALSAASIVVDAGAHQGAFARSLGGRLRCRIHALEPNSALSAPADLGPGVRWLPIGLGGASTRSRFLVSSNPEASSIRSDLLDPGSVRGELEVELLSLEDLLLRLEVRELDLLKLDIEGAEIELLRSAADKSLRAIRQLTVEFHSFVAGAAEQLAAEEVSRRLEKLGFLRLRAAAPALHDVDVLFLNRRSIRIPARTQLWIRCGEPLFTFLRRAGGIVRSFWRRPRGPKYTPSAAPRRSRTRGPE